MWQVPSSYRSSFRNVEWFLGCLAEYVSFFEVVNWCVRYGIYHWLLHTCTYFYCTIHTEVVKSFNQIIKSDCFKHWTLTCRSPTPYTTHGGITRHADTPLPPSRFCLAWKPWTNWVLSSTWPVVWSEPVYTKGLDKFQNGAAMAIRSAFKAKNLTQLRILKDQILSIEHCPIPPITSQTTRYGTRWGKYRVVW